MSRQHLRVRIRAKQYDPEELGVPTSSTPLCRCMEFMQDVCMIVLFYLGDNT